MKKTVLNALMCILVVIIGLFALNTGNSSDMDIINNTVHTENADNTDKTNNTSIISNTGSINNEDIAYMPVNACLTYYPSDIDDLEMNSDVIILARVLGSENVLLEFPADWSIEYHFEIHRRGFTRTELEVLQVFAGDTVVGDIFVIGEFYWIVEYENEMWIRHYSNYGPSTLGQEYLFFLLKHVEDDSVYSGMHFPCGFDGARYPVFKELVDASSRSSIGSSGSSSRSVAEYVESYTNAELNLANQNSRAYRDLYNDVVERYFSQISSRY